MVAISIYAISPLSPRYFCQYRSKTLGDSHFAQDDGEVSLTALEASLRATLRAQVVPTAEDKRLFGRTDLPFAISHGTLIPMGFSSTLDDVLSQSVEHTINMIAAMFEMPRQQVYLLLSAAIDFNVTQVVDITPKAFTV